ncbi:MAG TPA: hypothetical protein VKD90_03200 [Gemmataceae bacterium]|nr:hypothetical protein [Gemmataceae bacterium]
MNPDDPAYLRRQYAWFQTLDPTRQQQLRKLHEDFLALDAQDQARLTRVMQSYNGWLAKLSDEDRRRVLAAPSAAARLEAVRQLRERDWVDTLPRPYREEYERLDEDARRPKVQEWRAEEAERREEWAVAVRHWSEFQSGKTPGVFTGEALGAFVDHLRENLSDAERRELDDARIAFDDGNYLGYAFVIIRMADRHPVLPGRIGPKDFDSLPGSVKDYLVKHDPKHFRSPKGVIPGGDGDAKEVRRAQGRWPEFAVELTRYCQRKGLVLPDQLGDCRKDDMPAEVRDFVTRTLEPQLKRTEAGKTDLRTLEEAQGKWPEYPRLLVELAKKHKVPFPGWALPAQWDRFRAAKNRSGLVPRP